jgi:hypothetical protein
MFRARFVASERTDVATELGALLVRGRAKGLSDEQLNQMAAEVGAALTALVERGQALVANHSQMTVDRTLEGRGFRVQLHFQTGGGGGGFFARLRHALGL